MKNNDVPYLKSIENFELSFVNFYKYICNNDTISRDQIELNNNIIYSNIDSIKSNFILFQNNMEKLKNEKEKIQKEYEDLKIKYDNLVEENKKNEEEIAKLKKYIEDKENEIHSLKEDHKKLLENTKIEKENIIKSKKDEESEHKKKVEQIENEKNNLIKENVEKKSQIDNLENKIKENEDIIKKNEDMIKNISTRKEFMGDAAKDFYDVIIEIDSISKLYNSGWKINYNEKRKEIYERIIKEETIKIGVLGINNIGKSFILGLISGVTLPTGFSVETKGISIKYTEGEKGSDKGICLLDSAGFETPLLNEEILLDDEEKKK